ncbi:MAG TPA: hypothetical protein VLL52_09250 [Anaerolineae bacterium]|nr:hypothetical protein [Anaerolineae bacterium]
MDTNPYKSNPSPWRARLAWITLGLLIATITFISFSLVSNIFAQENNPFRPLTGTVSQELSAMPFNHTTFFAGDGEIITLVPQTAVDTALDTAVADGVLTAAQAQKINADIAAASPELNSVIIDHDIILGEGDIEMNGVPTGLLAPLHHAVAAETITDAQFRQIIGYLDDNADDAVTATFEDNAGTTTFELSINGNPATLQTHLLQAIDQAEADGTLTSDQAETLRQNVTDNDYTHHLPAGMDGEFIIELDEIITTNE